MCKNISTKLSYTPKILPGFLMAAAHYSVCITHHQKGTLVHWIFWLAWMERHHSFLKGNGYFSSADDQVWHWNKKTGFPHFLPLTNFEVLSKRFTNTDIQEILTSYYLNDPFYSWPTYNINFNEGMMAKFIGTRITQQHQSGLGVNHALILLICGPIYSWNIRI